MRHFKSSYVIISQTMTDMHNVQVNRKLHMSFPLAYLRLSLTNSKDNGQVNIDYRLRLDIIHQIIANLVYKL